MSLAGSKQFLQTFVILFAISGVHGPAFSDWIEGDVLVDAVYFEFTAVSP